MLIEIGNDSISRGGDNTGKSLADAFKNRVGNHRNSIENRTMLGSPKTTPNLLYRKSEAPGRTTDLATVKEKKRNGKDILAQRKEMMKSKLKNKVDNFTQNVP